MYLIPLSGRLTLSFHSELCSKDPVEVLRDHPIENTEQVYTHRYTHAHIYTCIRTCTQYTHRQTDMLYTQIHIIHTHKHTHRHICTHTNQFLFPYPVLFFFRVLFLPKIMFLHVCSHVYCLTPPPPPRWKVSSVRAGTQSHRPFYFWCPEQFLTQNTAPK